jgi:hypothetical protein
VRTCPIQNTAFFFTSRLGSLRTTSSRMSSVSLVRFCDTRNTAFSRRPAEHSSFFASTALRIGMARSAFICMSALSASARSSSLSPRGQGCCATVRPRCVTSSAARESPRRASSPFTRISSASASPRVPARV